MSEIPMFDVTPVALPESPKESADVRRTKRQRAAVDQGRHPLALVFAVVSRHPATRGQEYAAGDERARPFTCGSCRFRAALHGGARSYPKCTYGERMPRATHGAATDVRAWWPACSDYEAVTA